MILLLIALINSVQAAPIVILHDMPMMGGRDVTVVTSYDDKYFTGFLTEATETKTDIFGNKTVEVLYSHSVLDCTHAPIQHSLALAFVRDRHIDALMFDYTNRIRALNLGQQPKTPRLKPSVSRSQPPFISLYDIDEEDEEATQPSE